MLPQALEGGPRSANRWAVAIIVGLAAWTAAVLAATMFVGQPLRLTSTATMEARPPDDAPAFAAPNPNASLWVNASQSRWPPGNASAAPNPNANVATLDSLLVNASRSRWPPGNASAAPNPNPTAAHVAALDSLWANASRGYVRTSQQGRLGNLMFKTVSTVGIAYDNGRAPCPPPGGASLEAHFVGPFLSKRCGPDPSPGAVAKVALPRFATFEAAASDLPEDVEWVGLSGYLQSWRYWSNLPAEAVYSALAFKPHLRKRADAYLSSGTAGRNVTVGIHVRRRDQLVVKYTRFPPNGYFTAALRHFRAAFGPDNVRFLVASDDVAWCRRQTYFRSPDVKIIGPGNEPALDMCILAGCDHMVISVGTFGWWAAYLGAHRRGGDVLYYKEEFVLEHATVRGKLRKSDYYPPRWIEMDAAGVEAPGGTTGAAERSAWADHEDDKSGYNMEK